MTDVATASNQDSKPELRLIIAWPNPLAIFAQNLSDFLFGHFEPEAVTTSPPDYSFWHDIDLRTPFPRRALSDSVMVHAAFLALLYAISTWPQSVPHIADPLSRQPFHAYTLSPYLPELRGEPTHSSKRTSAPSRPDPALARQEILSLPKTPDNLHQTIVTPPKLKLNHDVELPNIVAYQPVAPLQPIEASEPRSSTLHLPALVPDVVGPAADAASLQSRVKIPTFQPVIIEPTPDVEQNQAHLTLPTFQSKVVEPAPDLARLNRGTSTNLARLAPQVAEPTPDAPQVSEISPRHSAQIIALNLHPAEVNSPVQIPSGNRSGAFAASTNGHPQAIGTPTEDLTAARTPEEQKKLINAPEGISVSRANPPAAPIPSPDTPQKPAPAPNPDIRTKIQAANRPPSMASIAPRQPLAHEATGTRSDLENRIFAGRRSYTLAVNMPNLNTSTGSWIIHFAESKPGAPQTPIAAPEVLSKSDPAYPGELLRDGVQGTVILTATIRADGSVGDIAIAKSLDPRLDQNAAEALSRWLFRPALKEGRAIDLQAVITVPFRARPPGF